MFGLVESGGIEWDMARDGKKIRIRRYPRIKSATYEADTLMDIHE